MLSYKKYIICSHKEINHSLSYRKFKHMFSSDHNCGSLISDPTSTFFSGLFYTNCMQVIFCLNIYLGHVMGSKLSCPKYFPQDSKMSPEAVGL